VTTLYDEHRVLLVPASHHLAAEESIGPDDFAHEPLAPCTGAVGTWSGFWRLEPRSDGSPAPLGTHMVDTFEDKLELVADGEAVAILPASDRRSTLREDLVTVPINDIEPAQVVVATRTGDSNPLVDLFQESARENLIPSA